MEDIFSLCIFKFTLLVDDRVTCLLGRQFQTPSERQAGEAPEGVFDCWSQLPSRRRREAEVGASAFAMPLALHLFDENVFDNVWGVTSLPCSKSRITVLFSEEGE